MYLLDLGEVKQTVNTATAIARLVNNANVKIYKVVDLMRKQKQYLFLPKENIS
jgi:hypothetical protein